jgi:probable phosphomutase (TIGR03848 family)
MTTLLLIRHALCDHVGREIAGRKADVHLNTAGVSQAHRLAEQLDAVQLTAIVSSSLARARETAAPLAERRKLPMNIDERLAEIDYGDWTGQTLDALRTSNRWVRFNSLRSLTRVPGGELMLEVQARGVSAIEAIREEFPDGTCAIVSHGDVIRGLVAHFAGIPLDLFLRIEIAPASVSIVTVSESWIGVRCVNRTLDGLAELF